MICYNMLASKKGARDYDTIWELLGGMCLGVHGLAVVEKTWATIIEVVAAVAELAGTAPDGQTIQRYTGTTRDGLHLGCMPKRLEI